MFTLPGRPTRKYDVVCLSLVVNFVPDPRERAKMMQRACSMLVSVLGQH